MVLPPQAMKALELFKAAAAFARGTNEQAQAPARLKVLADLVKR